MNTFNIEVEGGKTVKLPTAGKYCDRDIVVTVKGADVTGGDYQQGYKDGHATGYQEGYTVGERDGRTIGIEYEKENFMGNYQSSLNGDYESAFANAAWDDNSYNPVMDIEATKSAVNAFRKSNIVSTKVPIYLRCSLASAMFVNCKYLTTIPYIYFGEELTDTGTFANGSSNLEEITEIGGKIRTGINFSASKKLNVATLERIKNALADRRELSTVTKLTLNKEFQNLFVSNGWDQEIIGKNWQIAWGG